MKPPFMCRHCQSDIHRHRFSWIAFDPGKRQEYEKKLKKILTDDQYKSYQKMGPRGNGKAPKNKQRD